jgi:hypothetical protein
MVPEPNVEAVIVSPLGAITTAVDTDFVCAGLPASCTVAVRLNVPLAVGVPEIAPLAARVRPAGRLPEVIDHEYGAVPPLACSACE